MLYRKQSQLAKLNIEDLYLLHKTASQGNVTAAAKLLGIGQSTVSKRVKKVESALGITLFDRTSRGIKLTQVGEQFLYHNQSMMAAIEETTSFLTNCHPEPHGQVSVTLQPWFCSLLGGAFFAEFIQKYPNIQLDLCFPTNERLVHQGDSDIIIGVTPPACGSFSMTKVGTLVMDFFASESYLASKPDISHPRQLNHHRCLCFCHSVLPSSEWRWTESDDEQHLLTIEPIIRFEQLELGVELACHGIGVIWAPQELVNSHDKHEVLRSVFSGQYVTSVDIYAMHTRKQQMPLKVSLFLRELTKALGTKLK